MRPATLAHEFHMNLLVVDLAATNAFTLRFFYAALLGIAPAPKGGQR